MTLSQLPSQFFVEFAKRLLSLRKARDLTQQELADKAGLHVVQIRRYETNNSQPSLEAIKKLATALNVSADALVFDDDERNPGDKLRLHFEAVSQLNEEEQQVILELIDGMLLKHDVKRRIARTAT